MIGYYPYDAAAPHRPSLDDLGGDQKLDDETAIPGEGEPRADEWNNFARLHAAAARMLPLARVTVTFIAGAPTIEAVTSMRTEIAASDFNVTDNGIGDTTIDWAAGLLPPVTSRPCAYLHEPAVYYALAPSAISARVVTTNIAGAAADAAFTLEIW